VSRRRLRWEVGVDLAIVEEVARTVRGCALRRFARADDQELARRIRIDTGQRMVDLVCQRDRRQFGPMPRTRSQD